MAILSISVTHTALFCLIALFLILFSNPILILSSTTTTPVSTNPNFFDSQISLLGNAAFVEDRSFIQLTSPSIPSSGMVMYDKPVKFLNPNPRNGFSFSAQFSFSISPGKGDDGLMFLIAPRDSFSKFQGKDSFGVAAGRFFGVEFDSKMDDNVGDVNGNHVGVDVNSLMSLKIGNASDVGLVLNSGKKLQSWIDYDGSSKLIEVRLSESGAARPHKPLVSYGIDLAQMWKDEEVFVSIIGSGGSSAQSSSFVYSCEFVARDVPSSLHSQPLDPSSMKVADQSMTTDEVEDEQKSSFCPLSILAGLILTTGCGALVAFVVLFLWVVFVDRHRIQAEPDFKYENINVVVDNDIEVAKK